MFLQTAFLYPWESSSRTRSIRASCGRATRLWTILAFHSSTLRKERRRSKGTVSKWVYKPDKRSTRKLTSCGQNMEEVHMVVRIARRYNERGLKFCIITFYDPQRAAISKAMEVANLPTGCVYNVDSFQGMSHPRCMNGALRSTIAGRERSRLCNPVISPDPSTRIP